MSDTKNQTGARIPRPQQRVVSHNDLVKIIKDDDGHATDDDSWHLVDPCNEQGRAALCTQEFFGFGESSVVFETKKAKRGGVTCPKCLEKLKTYKAVKL